MGDYPREVDAIMVAQLVLVANEFHPAAPVVVVDAAGNPQIFEIGTATLVGGDHDGQAALMLRVLGPIEDGV